MAIISFIAMIFGTIYCRTKFVIVTGLLITVIIQHYRLIITHYKYAHNPLCMHASCFQYDILNNMSFKWLLAIKALQSILFHWARKFLAALMKKFHVQQLSVVSKSSLASLLNETLTLLCCICSTDMLIISHMWQTDMWYLIKSQFRPRISVFLSSQVYRARLLTVFRYCWT